jgi:dTDP-4-dehydrorhamnose reductase
MRILVTGINGQVGSALLEPLALLGTVLATDRTSLDLSRPNNIPAVLDQLYPDFIVNPAAYTAVDQAEDEQELAYRVNAEAPRQIALWAANHHVPVVHFSTDYVFDGSGNRPWREDDRTNPLSVYGASKRAGEIAVQEAGGVHLVVRTSWIFASRGRNFLNTIVRLARQGGELRIVADQIGAPTSARSIAEGLMSIFGGQSANIASIRQRLRAAEGIVHLTSSGQSSWHGFAVAIVDGLRDRGIHVPVTGVTAIRTKDFPTRAVRPLNSRLDTGRLKAAFDVQLPDWRDLLNVELDQVRSTLWQDH